MAPTVDADKKKRTIQRLLSPMKFSGDLHPKKKPEVKTYHPSETRTSLETAFLSNGHSNGDNMRNGKVHKMEIMVNTENSKEPERILGTNEKEKEYVRAKKHELRLNLESNSDFSDGGHSSVSSTSLNPKSQESDCTEVDSLNSSVENCHDGEQPRAVPYSQYYNKSETKIPVTYQKSKGQINKKTENNIMMKKRENSMQSNLAIKPEPLYRSSLERPRPRSVSPISAVFKGQNHFTRGSKERSTINSVRGPRNSIIYEEPGSQNWPQRESRFGNKSLKTPTPIFKRGTLDPMSDSSVSPTNSKRVSFSPSEEYVRNREQLYWPTRKGLSVEPPTRRSSRNVISPASPTYSNFQNTRIFARPLPTVPYVGSGRIHYQRNPTHVLQNFINKSQYSESESGSETGEISRILHEKEQISDDDQKRTNTKEKIRSSSTGGKSRSDEDKKSWSNRRDDPRRHTLSGDRQVNSNSVSRSMDLESPLSRGYPSSSNSMLFDDDPGIMSEVETSCTGFRRGNKQRSSLPVVRTPSKTLERPLGLVFLQYRNETKRSLLPNEITSLDTVKALFVRSFPRQLTMEYLDSPRVKIYIHDSNKDMFYELEDLRSHLNEIRDRTVLRLFESPDVGGAVLPPGLAGPPHIWDQDQSYFSEPEFDSEYQSQHIHKSKNSKPVAAQPYYMTHSFPPGSSSTLPRGGGGAFVRPYSPAVAPAAGKHSGYMSSPERAAAPPRGYSPYSRRMYDDNIYTGQFASRPSSITPIIDEEVSEGELLDDSYNLYGVGVKLPPGTSTPRTQFAVAPPTGPPYDATRIRVEHMERQLANLTGLVQKALTQTVPPASPRDFNTSSDNVSLRSEGKATKFGKDKSVSFEKSVSFSDEPPDMNSPVQHSPLHNEKERGKPIPPPKPLSLSGAQYESRVMYRDLQLTPEMYNQLRGLQKKTKDLRQELRLLRRMSLAQAHNVKETVRDTFIKIRSVVLVGGESLWKGGADSNRINVSREEDIYKQEMIRLESDLTELETTVEELRGNVINRKLRVNMADVENMALILSKSSKTVADLKLRFPALQEAVRSVITQEMERVDLEEIFLKDEPEKLETALRRCKKLTGTLVTLKRLASVQEQRVPDSKSSPTADEGPSTPTTSKADRARSLLGSTITSGSREGRCSDLNRSENALDSLLDELQSFSKFTVGNTATLRRVNSVSSENKPPVPDRQNELTNKRIPPPPPPRTSSKSPLASPTNLSAPFRLLNSPTRKGSISSIQKTIKEGEEQISNSSSCESVNSQEGIDQQTRQQQLELRHQELLRKQKALQEQYSRLQQLQRTTTTTDVVQLKKTGSESNILSKMNLGLSVASPMSGSLSHLSKQNPDNNSNNIVDSTNLTKTNKIYETDIL